VLLAPHELFASPTVDAECDPAAQFFPAHGKVIPDMAPVVSGEREALPGKMAFGKEG